MTAIGDVAIVGAGQAGTALAHGFRRAGVRVVAVTARTPESAASLAAAVGAESTDLAGIARCDGVVCIAVPDEAVAETAATLADLGAAAPGRRFVHTSGVLGLDALDPLRAGGAEVGVLHPVTPLVLPEDPATLAGKPFGYDASGDPAWVVELVERLGGTPVCLAGVDRVLYHAACVSAANLVVGLAGMAQEVFNVSGVAPDAAQELVGSLLTAAALGVATHGPAQALTGPVRRGDAAVVAGHLAALGELDPRYAQTYRVISTLILDLMEPGPARSRSADVLEEP